MRVIVTIQHPAHVHFFRHVIDSLRSGGHEVYVFVRENDLAVPLLEAYGIDHTVLVGSHRSVIDLALTQALYEWRLYRRARHIEPDVMIAIGGVAVSHVAHLIGSKSIVFLDNEGVQSHRLMRPFADVICTPWTFREDYGQTHMRYNGFQELAYLHPNRFDPDPDRLRAVGVDPDERYFFCRFKRWDALHDVGEHGLSAPGKRQVIRRLSENGTVYLSGSADVPPSLHKEGRTIPPTLVHQLLYFADGYVGDSATMATEAAVLGTPAVRIQSFAGRDQDMGNFIDLEERYGLLWSTADEDRMSTYVDRLLSDDAIADRWKQRRAELLDETIDVTEFVRSLIESTASGEPMPSPVAPSDIV